MSENEKNSVQPIPTVPEIEMPSFSNYNKFHWMLGGEGYALKQAKDMFAKDLLQAQAYEKQYCAKMKKEAVMTQTLFNHVCGLLEQSKTFYEVEALARYVFDDTYVPCRDEVVSRAKALKDIVPVWDYLKANPSAKRSF